MGVTLAGSKVTGNELPRNGPHGLLLSSNAVVLQNLPPPQPQHNWKGQNFPDVRMCQLASSSSSVYKRSRSSDLRAAKNLMTNVRATYEKLRINELRKMLQFFVKKFMNYVINFTMFFKYVR